MRTVFFGTPQFAVPALEALAKNSRFEVVAAVTQPDRPIGRKKILTPPPVKQAAASLGIPTLQPEKLKDQSVQDEIIALKAELAVVVAYGNLIPKRLLEALPRGFVNIHPSLLPKHRGAAPLTATILEGDAETGVCLMVLDEQMDHGPIIACRPAAVDGRETTETLRDKLAPIGADMLGRELVDWLDGKLAAFEQDHALATFCKPIESADAKIDWSKSAAEIDRLVRAMRGVTPAWTGLDGAALLIHETALTGLPAAGTEPGAICPSGKKLAVAAKDFLLTLESVQPAGGKIMPGQAFLNGHRDLIGKKLF